MVLASAWLLVASNPTVTKPTAARPKIDFEIKLIDIPPYGKFKSRPRSLRYGTSLHDHHTLPNTFDEGAERIKSCIRVIKSQKLKIYLTPNKNIDEA
jgi:hypothetical protein